jgi:hypothetical protein
MCRFIITGHESYFLNSPPTLRTSRTVNYLKSTYTLHPRILFLGSSRFKSCIDTPHIAQALGLPGEDVSSISVYSLGPWETKLLEPLINDQPLSGSPQWVVINIEPWIFNQHVVERQERGFTERAIDPKAFRRWASLDERLAMDDPALTFKLVLDRTWPLYERRTFPDWLRAGTGTGLSAENELFGIPSFHKPQKPNPSGRGRLTLEQGVAYHLTNYHYSEREFGYLQELLESLAKRDCEVVLVQPPFSKPYRDLIYSTPSAYAHYLFYREKIYSLAKLVKGVYLYESSAELGMSDEVFVDYGHYSKEGSIRFSQAFSKELEQLGYP